jgi:hypothetical protein
MTLLLRVLVVMGIVLAALPMRADWPQSVAECVLPRGGRRGTTVDAILYGKYLDEPRELVSSRGGIKATIIGVEPSASRVTSTPYAETPQLIRLKLDIAPDCPLGPHLLFLRTARFLSPPLLFHVSDLPILDEAEASGGGKTKAQRNDTTDVAEALPLDVTVHGSLDSPLDRDCYSVELQTGDRISAELEGVRLGTLHHHGEVDCQLRLLGPGGNLLASSDDSALHVFDPLLTMRAPADGRYVVEISAARGTTVGIYAHYRLHVGRFPRPTVAYPLGGRPGENLSVVLLGDGAGPLPTTVPLPKDAAAKGPLDLFEFWPETASGRPPSPLLLRVTPHDTVFESPSNTATELPQSFTVPAALNGVIGRNDDVDLWRFHAEKDTPIDIRVFARTLGTPLDPRISIRPAGMPKQDEQPLVVADDGQRSDRGYFACHDMWQPKGVLDPAITFRPKVTGDYLLAIEDTRGIGSPEHAYRIEIDPHADTLCLHIPRKHYAWTIRESALQVPRGNRWTVNLSLSEGMGTSLSGQLFLEADGLPPGVAMEAPVVTGGSQTIPVQFIAAPDAKPGVYFIRVRARPSIAGGDTEPLSSCQKAHMFVARRGGIGWHPVFMDFLPLGVVEEAPYRIDIDPPAHGLVQSGEIDLKVRIHRREGWDGGVQLRADWLPPGVSQGPPLDIPPGQNEATFRLAAAPGAAKATWKVSVQATSLEGNPQNGDGCALVSSPFVDLSITAPYVTIDLQRAAVERGGSGTINATIKHETPFSGSARLSLIGLPAGTRQVEPFPEVTTADSSCIFHIVAEREALVGQFKQIKAEIAVRDAGGVIRQQSGSGILRIDPARDGRPSS